MNDRPLLAVTMGDAAGVGPEVVVKALALPAVQAQCRPIVFGDAGVMRATLQSLGLGLPVRARSAVSEAAFEPGTLEVLDFANVDLAQLALGRVSAMCGKASMEYIIRAIALAQAGAVDGLVTAPINKEATIAGGYEDIGHLELIARLTGAKEYATMLMAGRLRTVHLTTHHSLVKACGLVTRERVLARLLLTDREFKRWGFARPRVAVAALNPHAGEGGMFGDEEIKHISPAVEEARGRGIQARGPLPADSVFNRAMNGEFDAVLAMYHDQGHIPVKVHGFEESVSVALGLPLVRTSVDHGTAFDIVGKGIADHRGMVAALRTAVALCRGALDNM